MNRTRRLIAARGWSLWAVVVTIAGVGGYLVAMLLGATVPLGTIESERGGLIGACPPGAPPNSSLCSPEGASVLLEWAETGGGIASRTAAPIAATASTAANVGWVSSVLNVGVGLGFTGAASYVTLRDWPASELQVDGDPRDSGLPSWEQGIPAGWTIGPGGTTNGTPVNVWSGVSGFGGTLTKGNYHRDVTWQVTVEADYGTHDPVTIALSVSACQGSGGYPSGGVTSAMRIELYNPSGVLMSGTDTTGTTAMDTADPRYGLSSSACGTYGATTKTYTGIVSNAAGLGHVQVYASGLTVGQLGRYDPIGFPARPPGSTDRTGQITRTLQCTGVAGMVEVTVTDTITLDIMGGFGETSAISCPEGTVVTGWSGTFMGPDGIPIEFTTGTVPSWVSDIPVEYPDCLTGVCTIQLWQLGPDGIDYDWCGYGAEACSRWVQDPARATNYQCRYGPYDVPLEWCAAYRYPGSVTPTTTVAGAPTAGANATPVPDLGVGTLPDPDPGDPAPNPGGDPLAPPGVDPYGPPVPGADLATDGECVPSGWGIFNPVQWVLRPVKCALVWAFVPREGVIADSFEVGRSALDAHGVLRVVPQVLLVPASLAGGWSGSCVESSVALSPEYAPGATITLLPCDPPDAASASAWETVRWIVGVLVVASAAWACFLIIAAQFGKKAAE